MKERKSVVFSSVLFSVRLPRELFLLLERKVKEENKVRKVTRNSIVLDALRKALGV